MDLCGGGVRKGLSAEVKLSEAELERAKDIAWRVVGFILGTGRFLQEDFSDDLGRKVIRQTALDIPANKKSILRGERWNSGHEHRWDGVLKVLEQIEQKGLDPESVTAQDIFTEESNFQVRRRQGTGGRGGSVRTTDKYT